MQNAEIKNLLRKYDIRPSKRLGQNFLIDKNVLKKIIEAANISPADTLLEIGPGLGILTLELAKRAKKVIAIEKDKIMCQLLREVLKAEKIDNVEIINEDILNISITASIFCSDRDEILTLIQYKLVANLPYYITSPVIRKFLEAECKPELMILMVQKEVAQRIIAKPPKMNLLAVAVQFYALPKIICYVSKNSFWPKPKVDSAIIKIVPYVGRTTSHIKIGVFFNLVKMGFSSKRKMLKNNLSTLDIRPSSVEGLEAGLLEKIGINPKARAENLAISDWIKLYEEIYKK